MLQSGISVTHKQNATQMCVTFYSGVTCRSFGGIRLDQNLIGERIKELRKAKDLTQEELANLMNTSRVQINQWETGARELTANRIIDFANALDTSCEYLLRGVPIEKAESYNQTGLDVHSLNAFADIMELPENKKQQYLLVLNGILGSDYFWREVMPHLVSAVTIQDHAVLGGAYAGVNDFRPEHVADKLKENIQFVTFCNTAGYTDHILINKETAIDFQLSEATSAFNILLKAIIEKQSLKQSNPLLALTKPYCPNNASDKNICVSDLIGYLKAMGLNLDAATILKENEAKL